jgi:hypothetical protein
METFQEEGGAKLDASALSDLYVYSVGHEIAAIRLSGEAANRCHGPIGKMLLTDLTVLRLSELRTFPAAQHVPARLAQEELAHLFSQPRGSHRQASLLPPEMVSPTELIGAVLDFDRLAVRVLGRMGPLLEGRKSRCLAGVLRDAKARWIRLYSDIQEGLHQNGQAWAH